MNHIKQCTVGEDKIKDGESSSVKKLLDQILDTKLEPMTCVYIKEESVDVSIKIEPQDAML